MARKRGETGGGVTSGLLCCAIDLGYSIALSATIESDAFDRGTDPVLQFFTIDKARGLVQYGGDAAMQSRIEELARKANEGQLTSEEQAEYAGYVRGDSVRRAETTYHAK